MTLGLALVKADGTPVTAEFLRPREWVDRLGLRAGAPLPIAVSELEVEGDALVTSITPCPRIATGAGRVVTGRFMTQAAGNLVRVLLADGTEFRATDVHPVWSVDREEWVPAGELLFGELLDTLAGPVAVERVERLESSLDVYNIEVHGEHVFRVTADGVLVHNAIFADCGRLVGQLGEQAAGTFGPKIGIASVLNPNGLRFPDKIDDVLRTITETKNVAYQHLSTQLRDYLLIAQRDGYQLILNVRKPLQDGSPGTRLSAQLLDRVKERLIILNEII